MQDKKCTTVTPKKSLKNMTKFKYLRMTVIYENYNHAEVKSTLNLGNASYYLVQNLLSSQKPKD
jgi:hypothetical protein